MLLKHSAEALTVYDSKMAALARKWDKAKNDDDVATIEAAEKAALMELQDAFHKDTSDRNSLDHCRIVEASVIRRWVEEEQAGWELADG
jgi:hypothetical protein